MPPAAIGSPQGRPASREEWYVELAWRIYVARCRRNLLQSQVARAIRIDPSTFCRVERAKQHLDAVRFLALCRVLGPIELPDPGGV